MVLQKLWNGLGKVVVFKDLDSQSTTSEASVQLRGDIEAIRKALTDVNAPYQVQNAKGTGYFLEGTSVSH